MSDLPLTESQLTILDVPDGPFLPLLRVELTDIEVHEAALALSEQLRHAFPQAGPLVVLGEGAELTALDDDDLRRLGLVRLDRFADGGDLAEAMRDAMDDAEGTRYVPLDLVTRLADTPDTPVDEIPHGERQPE
jgi:hypothetical protein